MKSLSLKVFPRTQARRSRVKKLRASGRVPAVIYGRQTQAQNLEVGVKEIEDLILHSVSETILVDLAVEGEGATRRLASLHVLDLRRQADLRRNLLAGRG